MDAYYVLDERGEPVPAPDLEAWTRWFERADRSIARTVVAAHITVLTTFRGVAETDATGTPSGLFETRVFGGLLDGEELRDGTRAEAVDRHAVLAEWCRIGNLPTHGIAADQLR